MKKQLLVILAILFCTCGAFAQNPNAQRIILTQVGGNIKQSRLTVPVSGGPDIIIYSLEATCPVSQYIISLAIKNQFGELEYECVLPSDGIRHTYYLPELPSGFYVLVLESGDQVFQQKILLN